MNKENGTALFAAPFFCFYVRHNNYVWRITPHIIPMSVIAKRENVRVFEKINPQKIKIMSLFKGIVQTIPNIR